MFTGIVETMGRVVRSDRFALQVESGLDDLSIGDSIAVNGVCLTVVSLDSGTFTMDVSEETLDRTNLGSLSEGDGVNLEQPLRAGDRFGGHIVQGHVDGVGKVTKVQPLDASVEMTFEAPDSLSRYLVEKGSVAVDGVSLTVTLVSGDEFSVALVPHTLEVTTLGTRRPGDGVNIEVDVMAKYVKRLMDRKREA